MHTRFLFSCILCLFIGNQVFAQDSLSLQQCIEYAVQHNMQYQQSTMDLQQQTNNLNKTRANILPTLNGYANQNYNFGKTIDPTTNLFTTQNNRSNTFSLSGDLMLFSGLMKMNQVRQAQWAMDASKFGLQKVRDDISLTVANYYLQILLLTERQRQLQDQVNNSKVQAERAQQLYDAGSYTQTKKYQSDAQLATDEANLIDITNQLDKQYLGLKQYMGYDLTKPLKVQTINVQVQMVDYTLDDAQKAITEHVPQLPAVQQAQSNVKSAYYGWKAQIGNGFPKLDVGGSVHSYYSSLAQYYYYNNYKIIPTGFVNGDTSMKVYGYSPIPTTKPISFNDQMKNNFGQSLGFTLNIPIFNGLQNKFAIQSTHITYRTNQLQLNDAQAKAKNDIYTAFENMIMARKKFEASQIKLKAQQSLFNENEITYNAGALNFYDYNAQRNAYASAQSDALQAQYEYIFQTKVFEYYLGKPVQF
jgi:outer membrane protein